jgi:hypothetical protein
MSSFYSSRKSAVVSPQFLRFGFLLFILHSPFSILHSRGQGLGNSPYSTLGVGETFSGGFAVNQMMGGAGVAASNGIYINNLNPALLARNRNVVFDVGVLGQLKRLNDGRQQQQTAGGNLNYLALALPINRRWTASIGLRPYSYVDYEVRETKAVPGSIYFAEYTYSGRGGLNQVAFSNGFQITKSLYAGVVASYLFGGIDRDAVSRLRLYQDPPQDYSLTLRNRINYHDFQFKGGLAWRQKLQEKLFLTAAGTYDFGTNLRSDQLRSFEYLNTTGTTIPGTVADTVNLNTGGTTRLAPAYRVGLALENPYKLTLSADLSVQQWSKFRGFNNTSNLDEKLADSYTISVGAEYTPNILAASGYWNRVPYRLGFSYGKTPYAINGQQPTEWSITTGLSMPISRGGLSDLNLGFSYGQRGVAGNGLIREQYGRVVLGVTLNDRWFLRQVID